MAQQNAKPRSSDHGAHGGTVIAKRGSRPRVKADIIAALARRVLSGGLKPGTFLPIEADLCAEYNVSRTVIREAAKVLESKGLLSIRPRIGTQIQEQGAWNFLDPDMIRWLENHPGMPGYTASLMEVRQIIEPAASALAARRATEADLKALENAMQRMLATMGADPDEFARADADFHSNILIATKNHVFMQFAKLINVALRLMLSKTGDIGQFDHIVGLHGQLLTAIQDGDEGRARHASIRILELSSDKLNLPPGRP